jgi:hypothetical protein
MLPRLPCGQESLFHPDSLIFDLAGHRFPWNVLN